MIFSLNLSQALILCGVFIKNQIPVFIQQHNVCRIHLGTGRCKTHSVFCKSCQKHIFHIPKHLEKEEEDLYPLLEPILQLIRSEKESSTLSDGVLAVRHYHVCGQYFIYYETTSFIRKWWLKIIITSKG